MIEKTLDENAAYKWRDDEMQERLFRMVSRAYFSIYTWLTYMQPIRNDEKVFRKEVKKEYKNCDKWCEQFQRDTALEFVRFADARELFLDLDDVFRTRPVREGSTDTVRDHIEKLHNIWYNELGKKITEGLYIISYAEAVSCHITICAIVNGAEIRYHPCLKTFNRLGHPASPLKSVLCVGPKNKPDSESFMKDVYPNTVCTFLQAHNKFIDALYKSYGYDRNKVIFSATSSFVKSINAVLNTLVVLYTDSAVFDIDVSQYVKDMSKKEMIKEFVNRTRLCANDKTW